MLCIFQADYLHRGVWKDRVGRKDPATSFGGSAEGFSEAFAGELRN